MKRGLHFERPSSHSTLTERSLSAPLPALGQTHSLRSTSDMHHACAGNWCRINRSYLLAGLLFSRSESLSPLDWLFVVWLVRRQLCSYLVLHQRPSVQTVRPCRGDIVSLTPITAVYRRLADWRPRRRVWFYDVTLRVGCFLLRCVRIRRTQLQTRARELCVNIAQRREA